MRYVVLLGCGVLVLAAGAWCEEGPPPVVENTGEGTAYAPPAFVEFWAKLEKSDADLEAAIQEAGRFESAWRNKLTEAELRPSEFEAIGPAVMSLWDRTAGASIRMRFSMAGFSQPETGPRQFAKLCVAIAKTGETLGCSVAGPALKPADPDSMTSHAVTLATENAYLAASAAAGALKSGIYGVDKVEVLEVNWNQPQDPMDIMPNLAQVSCTARVKVTYALSPRD